MYCQRFYLHFLFLGVASTALGEDRQQTAPLNRWAVLETEAVRRSGVADLVTVHLSQQAEIALVERERLDEVFQELELSELMASGNVDQRLKTGKLLGCDGLAILSSEQGEGGAYLRMVVVDCRYGVRLRTSLLPLAENNAEKQADWVSAEILAMRKQYANGVRRIIAVTPFESKNLTHDFEHLQIGFQAILQNALLTQPGVAVVEFQEAQAISRELSLTGSEIRRDVRPSMLAGVYRADLKAEPTTVDVGVRATSGADGEQRFAKRGVTIGEASQWLTDEFVRTILKSTDQQQGLTRREQIETLRARADLFATIGEWGNATAMREALLLLTPDNFDQRLTIVNEYRRWRIVNANAKLRIYKVSAGSNPSDFSRLSETEQRKWRNLHQQQVALWGNLLWHAQYLINSRRLSIREAEFLVDRLLRHSWDVFDYDFANLAQVRGDRLKFFWATMPTVLKLDGTINDGRVRVPLMLARELAGEARILGVPQSAARQTDQACQTLQSVLFANHVLGTKAQMLDRYNYSFNSRVQPAEFDAQEFLSDYQRLLQEFAQAGALSISTSAAAMKSERPLTSRDRQGPLVRLMLDGFIEEDELRSMYAALASSDNRVLKIYGLGGQGNFERLDAARKPRVATNPPVTPPRPRPTPPVNRPQPKLRPLDARTPWWEPASPAPRPAAGDLVQHLIQPPMSLGRVWLQDVESLKTEYLNWNSDVTPCGPDFDLWHRQRKPLRVMREKGKLETVFEPDEESGNVLSAVFDGENFWIGCSEGSLFVVSLSGERLAEINAKSGLPPFGLGLIPDAPRPWGKGRLQPLTPGKCVAIGTFGPQQRMWAALIEFDGDKKEHDVDVFFEARNAQPSGKPEAANSDAQIATRIAHVVRYDAPNGRRLLYVPRWSIATTNVKLRPLVFDITDRPSVTIAKSHIPWLPNQGDPRPRVLADGRVLASTDMRSPSVSVYQPDETLSTWNETKLIPLPEDWDPSQWSRSKARIARSLTPHGEYIYFAGPYWHRIHRETLQVEQLTDQMLPSDAHTFHPSAHYGLLAGSARRGVRFVAVDSETPTPEALKQAYSWVRDSQRAAHHQAVCGILRLGGYAGATQAWDHDGRDRLKKSNRNTYETTVLLPSSWQGSDDDLKLLAGLYRVRRVVVLSPQLSDRSLEHLAALPDLRTLYLAGPEITSAGLRQFEERGLVSLRLESLSGGAHPGDECLELVARIPALRELGLVGPGFSDRGVEQLLNRESSLKLMLSDTRVSAKSIAELESAERINLQSGN